jgi:hypothetical protein
MGLVLKRPISLHKFIIHRTNTATDSGESCRMDIQLLLHAGLLKLYVVLGSYFIFISSNFIGGGIIQILALVCNTHPPSAS